MLRVCFCHTKSQIFCSKRVLYRTVQIEPTQFTPTHCIALRFLADCPLCASCSCHISHDTHSNAVASYVLHWCSANTCSGHRNSIIDAKLWKEASHKCASCGTNTEMYKAAVDKTWHCDTEHMCLCNNWNQNSNWRYAHAAMIKAYSTCANITTKEIGEHPLRCLRKHLV